MSHASHFGGAMTGFLVSILVLKNFKNQNWEEIMQKICVGILISIVVIVAVINVTQRDFFPKNEWNFDYNKSYGEYRKYLEAMREAYDNEIENSTNIIV